MLSLAFDGVVSFSSVPLRLALVLGLCVSLGAFMVGFAAIINRMGGWYTVDGWASLMVVVTFLGGIQLTVMGILGEYVGRIYDESKQRPIYIAGSLEGRVFELLPKSPARGVLPVAVR